MLLSALIAEDEQNANNGVQKTLGELGFQTVRHAYYCDDALLELKWARDKNRAFDLLVTDLSFIEDGREQKITDGIGLITAARELQPGLKILVFSAEQHPGTITLLFKQLNIDGYVCKGRRDSEYLKEALGQIATNRRYMPAEIQQAIRNINSHDFSEYDILIISQIAKGTLQKELPGILKEKGVKATSLSSIEKRLNQIRDALGFKNNEQLVAYCKDHQIL